MTDSSDRIERTLEILLYAPIGIGLFLKDTAPTFVDMFVSRGRAEIDRRQDDVQQRVTTARSLGQVALAFGPPVIRKRVEDTVADAVRRAEGLFGSPASDPTPTSSPASTSTSAVSATPVTPTPTSPAPAVTTPAIESELGAVASETDAAVDLTESDDLPIPGYDALSASQVVARLTGLAATELDAVREYEASHRRRRTILGKIEQLAG